MEFQNDLLLRAAKGEPVERTPVWLMRQAGRVLPEYRAVRARLSGFKELVTTPELAAEVTVQPVDLLEVDAAIIFSDILVIPEAMGLDYEMIEKKGPIFPQTVRSHKDVDRLRVADGESDLGYVTEAIRLTKKELDGRVPLIGFAGAPFTIFCYMVEGQGSKTFARAKRMLYQEPELSRRLLEYITESTVSYLQAQVRAGADLIQLFDSWAGVLPLKLYQAFGIPYMKQILEALPAETPTTVFAKGAFFARRDLADLPCNVIGLDWQTDPVETRAIVGPQKALQGNLDPCALYGTFTQIVRETRAMIDSFGEGPHIANLGHGLYPDIDPDHVRCFVEAVKEYSEHSARKRA